MSDLNPDPASTWGASEEYKAAWAERYGTTMPSESAKKADWVDYAVTQGMDRDAAEASTRAELIKQYGGTEATAAPSQDTSGGGGGVDSGTPEGTADTVSVPRTH